MKLGEVTKQFELYISILHLSDIYVVIENNCCFTDCIKIFKAGMHSEVYTPIEFRL